MEIFENQVAGHCTSENTLGMFKYCGLLLKPITNETGKRELDFYEKLHSKSLENSMELQKISAKFYGKLKIKYKHQWVDCIALENLTKTMHKPCIMDVKIGRRTWDPNASAEKIQKENQKYRNTKEKFGFCIPGFQVYDPISLEMVKYDKQFGRNLTAERVPEAFKTFLNCDNKELFRNLVREFLSNLYEIQTFIEKEHNLRFYSSSLLFVYDASSESSVEINNSSGDQNLVCHKPRKIASTVQCPFVKYRFSRFTNADETFLESNGKCGSFYENKCRENQFFNNGKINNKDRKFDNKDTARTNTETKAAVKMIDFAHVFGLSSNGGCVEGNHQIDENYKEGLDNIIHIFESFLQ